LTTKERKDRSAAKPQPKNLNHGWQGWHGWEIGSESVAFIRVIREIRGKILAKMSDSDRVQFGGQNHAEKAESRRDRMMGTKSGECWSGGWEPASRTLRRGLEGGILMELTGLRMAMGSRA